MIETLLKELIEKVEANTASNIKLAEAMTAATSDPKPAKKKAATKKSAKEEKKDSPKEEKKDSPKEEKKDSPKEEKKDPPKEEKSKTEASKDELDGDGLDDEAPTHDDIRSHVSAAREKIAEDHGEEGRMKHKEASKAILSEIGATSISAIPDDKVAEILGKLKAIEISTESDDI